MDTQTLQHAAGICSHSATVASPNTDVGDQVWLTVGVPVHPKDVRWGWG